MRKLSLSLIVWMMACISVFAQSFTAVWERPKAPEFKDFATEDTLYLWNVGAGGFYVNHQGTRVEPYWGTRSVVSDTVGVPVIFTQKNPAGTDESIQFESVPEAYLMVSYVTIFGEYMCSFFEDWDAVWTDNNSSPNRYWSIVPSDGGRLRIEPNADLCALNKTGQYLGVRGNDDPEGLVYLYDTETEGAIGVDEVFYSEWAAVSQEGYDAYKTYLREPEIKDMVSRYHGAVQLKAAIKWAEEVGVPKTELAPYYEVYNNTGSSLETLQAAAAAVRDMGRWNEIKVHFEGIVQGEKNDVSGVFTNNDFSNGNTNGWTITYTKNSAEATNIGYQKAEYTNGNVVISGFIEAWKDNNDPAYLGDGSITQTIPSLPAGKYTLAVDAVSSNQGRIIDESNPKGYPDDVELFATASLDGKTYKTSLYTETGKPEHFEFTFVHTGGSMTLGIRVTGSADAVMPANWIAMDNLKLYYYGGIVEDPDKVLLDIAVEEALATYPIDELDGIMACETEKDAYRTLMEQAMAVTENHVDYIDGIKAAVKKLKESEDAYTRFVAAVEGWEENIALYESLESPLWFEFCDFALSMLQPENYPSPMPEDVMTELLLTPQQIEVYISQVDSLYRVAVASGLKAGMDCTFFLQNPDFKDGLTGWTTGNGLVGGLKAYPTVEVYEAPVDFSQTVENVPDGIYSLSCRAYERPGLHGSYDGSEESKVFLYMNGFRTGIMHLVKGGLPIDEAIDRVNCFQSGGKPSEGVPAEDYVESSGTTNADFEYAAADGTMQLLPNGMSGASYAFRAGRYEQKVYALVKGGQIKLGFTSDGATAHWVIWADLRLVYEGDENEAGHTVLPILIGNLQEYLQQYAARITSPASDAANAVISRAHEALDRNDKEAISAMLAEVNGALDNLRANVAMVEEAEAAILAFEENAYDYVETASPTAMQAYEELCGEIYDRVYMEYVTEEVADFIDKIDDVFSALKVPVYENATDDNPVDMTQAIVNPSFEEGLKGWSYNTAATGDTGAKDNSNATYTIDKADGGYVFNTWNRTTPAGGFWVEQTVKSLPAGLYRLDVVIASDEGNVIHMEINGDTVSYTLDTPKDVATEAYVIVELDDKEPLHIRVSSNAWFKADNFRLQYFGTDSSLIPSNITSVNASETIYPVGIYTIHGTKVQNPVKGINIIKYSDGSVRKIYVK
ncbi:MAG: hypothetical protein J6K05_01255 [Bacteroidaceae bacterium]|nr:hypothetical protein [Bacteroidaceae bacterium]